MARGLTQQAIADASGVDRSTVAKIESGDRRMTLDDSVLFARALDVPLLTLLDPNATITIEGVE